MIEWLLISIDLGSGRYQDVRELRADRFPTEMACRDAAEMALDRAKHRPTLWYTVDTSAYHGSICIPVAPLPKK